MHCRSRQLDNSKLADNIAMLLQAHPSQSVQKASNSPTLQKKFVCRRFRDQSRASSGHSTRDQFPDVSGSGECRKSLCGPPVHRRASILAPLSTPSGNAESGHVLCRLTTFYTGRIHCTRSLGGLRSWILGRPAGCGWKTWKCGGGRCACWLSGCGVSHNAALRLAGDQVLKRVEREDLDRSASIMCPV